tara:strand:- start:581 stop:1273 length:693 start_codon:yes stop_codon:yes gene_type:complete
VSATAIPSRDIMALVKLGIAAISASAALLDDILGDLTTAELAKAKTYWGTNPPTMVHGYARFNQPFPILALALTGDSNQQDYIGVGEEALLDGSDDLEGFLFKRRMRATYTLFVYADHPDVCFWYYRIVRRILNVGVRYLIDKGFDDPAFDGADLAPDTRYMPDNVFVRKLTIVGEYEEEWDDNDALWVAINGTADTHLTGDGTVDIMHEDQYTTANQGVQPTLDSEMDS